MNNQTITRAQMVCNRKYLAYNKELLTKQDLHKKLCKENLEANESYISIIENDLSVANYAIQAICEAKVLLDAFNKEEAYNRVSNLIAQNEYKLKRTFKELKGAYERDGFAYMSIIEKDITCYNNAINELKAILNEID